MSARTLLVIGAAGDVGQGIVAQALASGRKVVAAGRSRDKLERIHQRHACPALQYVVGDLRSPEGAAHLRDDAVAAFGGLDEVVVSVNASPIVRPVLEARGEDLIACIEGNVLPHLNAAKTFLPCLNPHGFLLGVGGGTADFVFPGLVPMSMAQAALRMLYRGLGKECREGAHVRELMIISIVAGESNRADARPEWITDEDVGRHVCTILDAPESFPGIVLQLRSREQVGRSEGP